MLWQALRNSKHQIPHPSQLVNKLADDPYYVFCVFNRA